MSNPQPEAPPSSTAAQAPNSSLLVAAGIAPTLPATPVPGKHYPQTGKLIQKCKKCDRKLPEDHPLFKKDKKDKEKMKVVSELWLDKENKLKGFKRYKELVGKDGKGRGKNAERIDQRRAERAEVAKIDVGIMGYLSGLGG